MTVLLCDERTGWGGPHRTTPIYCHNPANVLLTNKQGLKRKLCDVHLKAFKDAFTGSGMREEKARQIFAEEFTTEILE